METSPVTCHTLEEYYHIDGHQFEKQYKEVLSGYRNWERFGKPNEQKPNLFGLCHGVKTHFSRKETISSCK